jgi:hypothetical protein
MKLNLVTSCVGRALSLNKGSTTAPMKMAPMVVPSLGATL